MRNAHWAAALLVLVIGPLTAQAPCPKRVPTAIYAYNGQLRAVEAKISPDGQWVAVRGVDANGVSLLFIRAFGTTSGQLIHAYPALSIWTQKPSFVWSRNSRQLFYVAEGQAASNTASVRSAFRSQPFWNIRVVKVFTGVTRFRLVGGDGALSTFTQNVYISYRRFDQDALYILALNPAIETPVDWTGTTQVLTAHDVTTATGTRYALCSIANRSGNSYQYYGYKLDGGGSNPRLNVGGAITQLPNHLDFAGWRDPTSSLQQVLVSKRVGAIDEIAMHGGNSTHEALTANPAVQRSGPASGAAKWGLYMSEVAGTNGTQWRPTILRNRGGGEIRLHDVDQPNTLGVLAQYPPSLSDGGDRVAYCMGGSAYTLELDRELEVWDRANVGGTQNMRLPVSSGENAAIVVSVATTSTPFTLTGICSALFLDPSTMQTIGIAQGSDWTASFSIPNDPSLVGVSLFYQALRWSGTGPNVIGDFTRVVQATFF